MQEAAQDVSSLASRTTERRQTGFTCRMAGLAQVILCVVALRAGIETFSRQSKQSVLTAQAVCLRQTLATVAVTM